MDEQRMTHETDAESILRSRVWTLRPALDLAVKRLREVYPQYADHHEGGEIVRAIRQGEQALAETVGPTPRGSDALAAERARAERAEAEVARLREVVQDFERSGLRCDLMPTNGHERDWLWWQGYLMRASDSVRSRARAALAAPATADPNAPPKLVLRAAGIET